MSFDKLPVIDALNSGPLYKVVQEAEILLDDNKQRLVYVAGKTRTGVLVYKTEALGNIAYFNSFGIPNVRTRYINRPSFTSRSEVLSYVPLRFVDGFGLESLPLLRDLVSLPLKVAERAEVSFTKEKGDAFFHHSLVYILGKTKEKALIYDLEVVRRFARRRSARALKEFAADNIFYLKLLVEKPNFHEISNSQLMSYRTVKPLVELISCF
ncbi:MAG: hypothetical protein ABIG52_03450 [Nanoarchaeota archaeon]|nr:hypothetical protein [Nanoarchaeota archaeon]MBU1644160.1 hypothetical protein [Nanoarchaeota archaeon]